MRFLLHTGFKTKVKTTFKFGLEGSNPSNNKVAVIIISTILIHILLFK